VRDLWQDGKEDGTLFSAAPLYTARADAGDSNQNPVKRDDFPLGFKNEDPGSGRIYISALREKTFP